MSLSLLSVGSVVHLFFYCSKTQEAFIKKRGPTVQIQPAHNDPCLQRFASVSICIFKNTLTAQSVRLHVCRQVYVHVESLCWRGGGTTTVHLFSILCAFHVSYCLWSETETVKYVDGDAEFVLLIILWSNISGTHSLKKGTISYIFTSNYSTCHTTTDPTVWLVDFSGAGVDKHLMFCAFQ